MSLTYDPGPAEPGPIHRVGILTRLNWLRENILALLKGENVAVGNGLSKRAIPGGYVLEGTWTPQVILTAGVKDSETAIPFDETPASLACVFPMQELLIPANSTGFDFAGKRHFIEGDSNTPALTFSAPGHYLLHYRANVGFDPSCAQLKNLPDSVARLRLKIGGWFREETAIYGTLTSKFCATGLVYDVGGTIGEGLSVDSEGSGSGSGGVSGELDVPVEKVAAYSRWAGHTLTLSGTYQLTVAHVGGQLKILKGLRSPTGTPTLSPTIELFVDRCALEGDPGVEPLEWLDSSSVKLRCSGAQLHLVRLG